MSTKNLLISAFIVKNIVLGCVVYFVGKNYGNKMYNIGYNKGYDSKELEIELNNQMAGLR